MKTNYKQTTTSLFIILSLVFACIPFNAFAFADAEDPAVDGDDNTVIINLTCNLSHLVSITYGGAPYTSGSPVSPGKELKITMKNNKAGTNVEIPLTLKVDDVEMDISYDKSSWSENNSEYKRRMNETATMATFDRLTSSSTTMSFGNIDSSTEVYIEYFQLTPVYRLYNMITSEHLFTSVKTEYDNFEALCKKNKDYWIGEGIDWLSSTMGRNVYRLYNPELGKMGHSSHYYTADTSERDRLKSQNGWQDDFNGAGVFCSEGDKAIFTCYNEALKSAHHLTSSLTEYKGLVQHGWDLETYKSLTNNEWTGFFKAWMGAKTDDTDEENWSGDILIGSFTKSGDDWTDVVYYSNDGNLFRQGAVAHQDPCDGSHMYNKNGSIWYYPMTCPSIIYKDGFFWMLSSGGGWLSNNKASFVISCSKDFKTWTVPIGFTASVQTSTLLGSNQVAPEWFYDEEKNELYIIQSMGDYGDFSGAGLGNDKMRPYICKVNNLTATDIYTIDSGLAYPKDLNPTFTTMNCMTSVVKSERGNTSDNVIDCCMYKENGIYYLVVKNKGVITNVYQAVNPTADNWIKVNSKQIAWGYEGPSLVKFSGSYRLYMDGVYGTLPVGIKVQTSSKIAKGWGSAYAPVFMNSNGNTITARHGSVFVLKAGSAGWKQIRESFGLA